ncbi:GDSL-type esterase/lipase family protein [Synechococcus sp. BA-124 BA4]|jgi:lysophospholipase L1-like esterase|uniref:SGNH/GDSL hydrolase family protein n=1 Tax=unclassified Synechococcus TaxID=2626047 RepID=UPI0018CF3DA2|nr:MULTISPECIES: GDSL-type esterase/lipase family protein [unclassified Synechococcus]MEA5398762.1 GDSL-type esterase/lipase family protein [Synechococcus sp. BA-124 BA4]QPN57109.1 hypothetical protein I1E95_02805 [Synechococcus sp. CBW1107]CAK6694319.1 hypothetical protein BBFGKLBO_01619 [Synechococcus sp. CBW1107]
MVQHKNIIRIAVAAVCTLAFPLAVVSLSSEEVRYEALQIVTSWRGRLIGIHSVYVGDSITSAGRHWGAALGSINLAEDGYTVRQIGDQLVQAKQYSPERIFMLAGTNDVLSVKTFDPRQFELDYSSLLDRAQQTKAQVFITLIPFTSRAEANQFIPPANQIIKRLARSRGIPVIDLNPTIAPRGLLLTRYTVDGVHFSDATYSLWRAEIESAIRQDDAK